MVPFVRKGSPSEAAVGQKEENYQEILPKKRVSSQGTWGDVQGYQ